MTMQIDNFSAARPHAEYLQMSKKLSDHDYIVQFVMKDVEDFKQVWDDPEFRKNVMPDHENFADTTRSGYVLDYLQHYDTGLHKQRMHRILEQLFEWERRTGPVEELKKWDLFYYLWNYEPNNLFTTI
jgi:hypothetical protein